MSSKPKKNHPWLTNYPVDVDWHAKLDTKSMNDVFDSSVKKYAHNTFINFLGTKYSFKEVSNMVDRMAKNLQDQGVKKGSKIGLALPNSPFYIVAYYAILKTGATVVNLNPLYPEDQMEELIKDSETEMVFTLDLNTMYPKISNLVNKDNKLKKIISCDMATELPFGKKMLFKLAGLLGKTGQLKTKNDPNTLSYKNLLEDNGKPTKVEVDPENDVAVFQFTGGTTGIPKAAMLTHKNLTANTQQAEMWFTNMEPGKEKFLAVLPFFHVFAMTVEMNMSLQTGTEMVILPRPETDKILEAVKKEKPTIFAGVPTMYQDLNTFKDIKKYDLSSLKACISGGAALSKDIKADFEKLSGCTLFEGYGLSETSPIATANPVDATRQKTGTIGLPMPQTKIKLMDLEFPDKEAKIGFKGEICIQGPQVMKGYWKRPDATKESTTKDGYFRTGDIGIMDDQGYVTIVDRLKDMIITGGFNVYPSKVEKAIREHDAIEEVIVDGVKDDRQGESVKAYIVLKEGKSLTQDELKAFLKEKLAGYERPRLVEFRKDLPRTMIGKPDKKALREEEAKKAFNSSAKNSNVANDNPQPSALNKKAPNKGPK